jgi:hypothetical protein
MMMKTLTDLLDSLKLTNNGYLFAPMAWELEVARKHPEAVDIRRGQIHQKGVQPCHPREPAKIDWSKLEPVPDYEGAILARQERMMMDY